MIMRRLNMSFDPKSRRTFFLVEVISIHILLFLTVNKENSEIDDAANCFYVPQPPFSPLYQMQAGTRTAFMSYIILLDLILLLMQCSFRFQNGNSDAAINSFRINPADYPSESCNFKLPIIQGFDYKNMDGVFVQSIQERKKIV